MTALQEMQDISAPAIRAAYLDLMKRCLSNSIYQDAEFQSISMKSGIRPMLAKALKALGLELVRKVDPTLRESGKDWPLTAHTMIGEKRLSNIQYCVETALQENVPGDLIETGVWRGGASIFMKAILRSYGVTDRLLYVADSFQGLPKPTHEIDIADESGDLYKDEQLAVSLEKVQANFSAYGLLDDQVRFLKGWFRDTLPKLQAPQFAIVRLDGDLYESTMDGLVNLYPKLAPKGFLIIDDYNIPACRQAVERYRSDHGITEDIQKIDWTGVFWRKRS